MSFSNRQNYRHEKTCDKLNMFYFWRVRYARCWPLVKFYQSYNKSIYCSNLAKDLGHYLVPSDFTRIVLRILSHIFSCLEAKFCWWNPLLKRDNFMSWPSHAASPGSINFCGKTDMFYVAGVASFWPLFSGLVRWGFFFYWTKSMFFFFFCFFSIQP